MKRPPGRRGEMAVLANDINKAKRSPVFQDKRKLWDKIQQKPAGSIGLMLRAVPRMDGVWTSIPEYRNTGIEMNGRCGR